MSTDRPPPDDAADRMRAIAERARRRSTQATELARLTALEIEAFGNGDVETITRLVRTGIDRAVDASAAWHSQELARTVEALDGLRAELEASKGARTAMRLTVLRYLRGDLDERALRAVLFA
jgi:hypothetical protein